MSDWPRPIGARALIRELGDCFESHGWVDQSNLALAITENARAAGLALDPAVAAAGAPVSFLAHNEIDRAELERALKAVFAGRSLLPAEDDYPAAINNVFEIHGDGNVVSNVNLGGQQYNLTNESSAEEVISAVGDLVFEGLDSGLSDSALQALDSYVETRPDINQAQIEAATREAIEKADPEPGRLARMRDQVTASVASGLLVQGIIVVLAALL